MNHRRLSILLAALALIALALSACAGPETPGTSATQTGRSTTAPTPGTSDTAPVPGTSDAAPVPGTSATPDPATTWSLRRGVDFSEGEEFPLPVPEGPFAAAEKYYNYLTGEETGESETLGIRRPTAVAFYNSYEASKFQCGTSDADVIWEIQSDSGVTSLIGLYYNPVSIAKMGPVRSVLPSFVYTAEGYDAYILHYGTFAGAAAVLTEQQSDHIDSSAEDGTECFYVDSAISYASQYYYSVFTTSGRIAKSLLVLNGRNAHSILDERYRSPMVFADEAYTPDGNRADRIHLTYGGFQPYFLYKSATGLYERYQHGAPHRDLNNGETLAFANVVVLYASSSYSGGATNVELVGSGSGIFATGGRYINILWSKPSAESPMTFTDGAGAPVVFNRGKTFISVVTGTYSLSIT